MDQWVLLVLLPLLVLGLPYPQIVLQVLEGHLVQLGRWDQYFHQDQVYPLLLVDLQVQFVLCILWDQRDQWDQWDLVDPLVQCHQ